MKFCLLILISHMIYVVRTKQITIDLLRKTTLFHCYGKCFEINSLCFIKKN